MARVLEFRVALTVEDYDEALRFYRDGHGLPVEEAQTPWGDTNVRVRAPDGMQLTLFTTP